MNAVLVDRHGVLWVGTDAGLDRAESSSGNDVTFTHLTVRSNAPLALIDTIVTALHEDSHVGTWLTLLPADDQSTKDS